MSRVIDISKPQHHPPAKKSKRKGASEWRSISRSHRMKTGRALILAIRDPRRPGQFIIGEAYWHVAAGGWWWSNTGPEIVGTDAIGDVYNLQGACWLPMPSAPPMQLAA